MSNSNVRWFILKLNAEPWAVGNLGIGRRGKTPYPYLSPNQKLQAYQEAVREELDGAGILEGEVEVKLFIWRKLETAKVMGGRDRKAKTSDATNIQKATEDAIQGILIQNDRNVRKVSTEIVAQDDKTEPCIVIQVGPYEPFNPDSIPEVVWGDIDRVRYASEPWRAPDDGMNEIVREEEIRAEDYF